MHISASDVFLEVVGTPRAQHLETLPGVETAQVFRQARVGDSTVHLHLAPNADVLAVRAALEEGGVQVLALKRAG
jgi:hypothetical protein